VETRLQHLGYGCMNAIIHAALDPQDRLQSDDPRLGDLYRRLGGAAGTPISLPPIAALGRAARRLGRMVTRPVALSAPNADIALWVRAQPEAETVRLTLFDWTEEPIEAAMTEIRREDTPQRQSETPIPSPRGSWAWRVDADFRLLDVSGPKPLPPYGMALTRWLTLGVDEDGVMPLLVAVAARASFIDQPVRLGHEPDVALMLAGEPVDVQGRFAGYRGTLAPASDVSSEKAMPEVVPPIAPPAGTSLDNALRRPLGRIIANAETISGQLEGPLRRDYATYAADIAVAGRHLMALVDDLADLRAIERPAFTVAREQVDLADVARRAAGLLGVKAADRRIRLDLPARDEPIFATAEFRRVLQILVNLIGNAVRYSPEDSQVWVRGEIDGDRAAITVADQGRGIAPEDQERVFDKFERLGRRDSGGSGLGLYISRRLARAMGGDLRLDSAPGQGARFTLSLPIWTQG
jgi:two-component sensor histidine kinase